MSHRPVSKRASIGIPILSWGQCSAQRMQMAKRKRHWCTIKHPHNETVLRKFVESLSTKVGDPQCTKTQHISSAPKRTPNNGRVRCRHMECGRTRNNFTYLQNLHISTPLEEKLFTGCLRPLGTCHHMQIQSRRKEGGQRTASCANASLPRAQQTRWQQQTGADERSVRPRRRESWSR